MRQVLGFALLLASLIPAGCQKAAATPPKAPPPPEVIVTQAVKQSVVDSEEYPGRLAAQQSVEVRARVTGYLQEVLFKDGDIVCADQVLFRLDPRPYQAEVDRTEAALKQAEARLERTSRQEQRLKELVDPKVISQEEYEVALFDRSEAESAAAAARASYELAKLNLEYTEVKAKIQGNGIEPAKGRISRRLVDVGNLVRADDTLLANIVSLDPIYAYFAIDERTMLRLQRLMQSGKWSAGKNSAFPVELALADEDKFDWKGEVTFLDNQVDPHTGTLAARAVIQNETGFLVPGLFVRMRTPIGDPHPALTVPEEALGSDQGQRFLYVVDQDNKVVYRRVKVGLIKDGQRVIEEGLKPGERFIVTGLQRVRPGIEVAPKTAQELAAEQARAEAEQASAAAKSGPHPAGKSAH